MKVLVINGFAKSAIGDSKFQAYFKYLSKVFESLKNNDVSKIDIQTKHRSELDTYLFELNSEYMNPEAITKFDQIDFVFIDGNPYEAPWSPKLKKVLIFLRMCFFTNKCVFGSGFTATMLSYICSTSGNSYEVLTDEGFRSNTQPPDVVGGSAGSKSNRIIIEKWNGDYYQYDREKLKWVPAGNVGILLHSETKLKNYGTRKTAARASGRKPFSGIGGKSVISKLGEVKCCARLHLRQHWVLEKLESLDCLVYCSSIWDLDEDINRTGGTCYETIIDSSRGPLLLEYGNLMAAHFQVSERYPETRKLLETYIRQKHRLIKVNEHIDVSFVSTLSKESVNNMESSAPATNSTTSKSASSKGVSIRKASTTTPKPLNLSSTIDAKPSFEAPARPDSRNCRPASPKRVRPQTARPTSSCRPSTGKSTSTTKSTKPPVSNNQPKADIPIMNLDQATLGESKKASFSSSPNKSQIRVQRVQSARERRPYTNYQKHKRQEEKDKKEHTGYYSIANDGKYVSEFEKNLQDYHNGKKHWKGGQFRVVFGKATFAVKDEAGIVNTGPYRDDLTVHNITNRVDNPSKFVDPKQRFRT